VHQIKPLHPTRKHTQAKAKQALSPPKLALAKAKAKTAARRPSVIAGVPAPLSAALRHHKVVVLALVAPRSQVDRLTLAEAKAGAAAAHAGFAIVNVANNAQVEALSALVGSSSAPQNRLLDDPSVLVFQRPQTLYVRLNGYVDADTVEQAAVNAVSLSY
jgi:fructose-specific component phosphotransferase system IIB-like protein